MNVLSLFDGMSCGRIALERAGIPVTNYYSSEIDKYAIKVAAANWPENIHLGDVQLLNYQMLPEIDLLIGGSPCQGFSFAGKQLNFDDPRSALFFEFVHALKVLKPKYFMLENVKMKKEYLDVISEQLGVEPMFINSSLVSAQNRQRYYWTNIPGIEQPENKGIVLADILESESDNFTFMSERFVQRQTGRKCLVDDFDRKASNLSAMEYVKNGRQGDYIKCGQMIGRRIDPETGKRADHRKDIKAEQRIEVRDDDKTGAITTVQKDNLLIKQTPRGNNPGGLRALNGKTPTLTSNSWEHNNHLTDGIQYRKLTPIECERLQTVPDNYTNHVSNSQRYKMLGNGWTIDVIAHIFKGIN